MLAAWLRLKYPHLVEGAVAASAPLGAFPGDPKFHPSKFWEVVTRDATPAAGAVEGCDSDVRAAFKEIFALATSSEGRQALGAAFRLCDTLHEASDVSQQGFSGPIKEPFEASL